MGVQVSSDLPMEMSPNGLGTCLGVKYKDKIDLIRSSDIDFTKFGYATKISKLIGISSQHMRKFLKMYMPDILEIAFKRNKKAG